MKHLTTILTLAAILTVAATTTYAGVYDLAPKKPTATASAATPQATPVTPAPATTQPEADKAKGDEGKTTTAATPPPAITSAPTPGLTAEEVRQIEEMIALRPGVSQGDQATARARPPGRCLGRFG